jgi:molecular chaperone DnaJ
VVHLLPNRNFERDGDDLVYRLVVGFPQAALGAEVEVPTLEGSAIIKVPSGTQSGDVIRLRGKGMPRLRGYGRGNLLVRVYLTVPEKLTQRQKELLEELAKEFGQPVQPKGRRLRL